MCGLPAVAEGEFIRSCRRVLTNIFKIGKFFWIKIIDKVSQTQICLCSSVALCCDSDSVISKLSTELLTVVHHKLYWKKSQYKHGHGGDFYQTYWMFGCLATES